MAGRFRQRMARSPQADVVLHRVAAGVYVLLAGFTLYGALRP